MISPYAILLFGGDIHVDHLKGILTVDEWISFKAAAKIAVLIKGIRTYFGYFLQQKIEQPAYDLHHEG